MADQKPSEAAAARKITAPVGNPETKPFWDAAKEGRFPIGRCTACGKTHYYPRSLCPFCFGEAAMEEASGEGTIYTVSVTYRGTPEPYAIGYVELKEGPRILTNFVDCDFKALAIGQAVKLRWTPPTDGGTPIPMFAPA
jgi:uncharacterized OB-fold protein